MQEPHAHRDGEHAPGSGARGPGLRAGVGGLGYGQRDLPSPLRRAGLSQGGCNLPSESGCLLVDGGVVSNQPTPWRKSRLSRGAGAFDPRFTPHALPHARHAAGAKRTAG